MIDPAPRRALPRRGFSLGDLARRGGNVVKGLFTHHAFDHAATMTFYFFLGAIPLLVVVGLLVGSVVQRDGAAALAAPLYRVMPKVVADLFRTELHQIGQTPGTTLGPLSLFGFLWLTTNGIHNLMDVFELLVGARPRRWLRQRVIATLWVAAAVTVLAAATWVLLILKGAALGLRNAGSVALLLGQHASLGGRWPRLGVVLLFATLLAVGLAFFYRTAVAHPNSLRRRVWPGTVVALILWALVSWVFGRYVQSIGDYALYYGGLATVAVALVWLYLTCLALVVGAEVNAELEGARR